MYVGANHPLWLLEILELEFLHPLGREGACLRGGPRSVIYAPTWDLYEKYRRWTRTDGAQQTAGKRFRCWDSVAMRYLIRRVVSQRYLYLWSASPVIPSSEMTCVLGIRVSSTLPEPPSLSMWTRSCRASHLWPKSRISFSSDIFASFHRSSFSG